MATGVKPEEYVIEEQRCDDGELHKDVAKSVLVFVGVNNKELDESMDENSQFRKEHAIGVEKVHVPKGWKGNAYIINYATYGIYFHCIFSYYYNYVCLNDFTLHIKVIFQATILHC